MSIKEFNAKLNNANRSASLHPTLRALTDRDRARNVAKNSGHTNGMGWSEWIMRLGDDDQSIG
ncbi:MAG: hypothetical protein AAF772_14015 [Acidobacteriota bacterium]